MAPRKDFCLYTEYQRGFPRFRYRCEQSVHVVLFSDTYLILEPLKSNILQPEDHEHCSQYSKEIEDMMSAAEIPLLPLPRLQPLFAGACRRYRDYRDDIAGIAVEQLIDGMDLDEDWCRKSISENRPQDLEFALARLEGKSNRTAHSFLNKITCYIADEDEAGIVHAIPGRDILASKDFASMEMDSKIQALAEVLDARSEDAVSSKLAQATFNSQEPSKPNP